MKAIQQYSKIDSLSIYGYKEGCDASMDAKRYTLMNKNRPVLDFLYNLDAHHVVKILKRRELDFAPPAILDMKGNPTRAALDGWWLRRAIPASRAQTQRLMAELHVDSMLAD